MNVLASLLTFVLGLVSVEALAKPTKIFRGAWFAVAYPADFIAVGSMKSATADGFDSAYFRDPTGRVEFYVFSPQAGGDPADIKSEISKEKLVKENFTKSAARNVRWATYAAPDGAYFRSFEEVRTNDQLQIRVFAFKYRSQSDLAANRASYERFKKSFEAYAD
ncbi:MAG: hypothetical protein N2444_05935 [Methylocystis sp.]|nr:hypothetical protein [Methylocystis sp.]